jgi:hypothetical protein
MIAILESDSDGRNHPKTEVNPLTVLPANRNGTF